MKWLLVVSALSLTSIVNAGTCELIDYDGKTKLGTINWDVVAGRICGGSGCNDVETVVDSNKAYVGIKISSIDGRVTVYYAPGCWNHDVDLGYVLYSGNSKPYFLKNCRLEGRNCPVTWQRQLELDKKAKLEKENE